VTIAAMFSLLFILLSQYWSEYKKHSDTFLFLTGQ